MDKYFSLRARDLSVKPSHWGRGFILLLLVQLPLVDGVVLPLPRQPSPS